MGHTACLAGILLSDYNLIATGDVTDQSDVQGRVLIGGTLHSNAFTFGGHLTGSTLTPPAGIFHALSSNVTALNNNGKNFIFGSGGPINGQVADPTATAAYTNGLSPFLSGTSAGYAALPTNSTIDATDPNQIKFMATPTPIDGHSVAVFSVAQSFFTQSGTVSNLTGLTPGETLVINVTGSGALNFGPLNFSAFHNAHAEAYIIFNFKNTTALNGMANLGGSILAPSAVLNTNSSLVGSVYVMSISNTGEIDQPHSNGSEVTGFQGFVPGAVPEPASIVSMLTGLCLVVGVVWFSRRLASRMSETMTRVESRNKSRSRFRSAFLFSSDNPPELSRRVTPPG
jgi:hypothetical protein